MKILEQETETLRPGQFMNDAEYARRLQAGIREFQVKVASPWRRELTGELRQIYQTVWIHEPVALTRSEIAKLLHPDWPEIDTYTWARMNHWLQGRLPYLVSRGLLYECGRVRDPYFVNAARTSQSYRAVCPGQVDFLRARQARRTLYALVDHLNERKAASRGWMAQAVPYNGRAATMLALRLEGWTLARIGQEFGLTRERVRQILGKAYREGAALARALDPEGVTLSA